jgi:hypothetical protein
MRAKELVGSYWRTGMRSGRRGELLMGGGLMTVRVRVVAGAGQGLEDQVGRAVAVFFLQLSGWENDIPATPANQRCGDGKRQARARAGSGHAGLQRRARPGGRAGGDGR